LFRSQWASWRSIKSGTNPFSDLLAKNMITQAEYEAKRQQILAEI